jgi:hypothetical protein
MPSVEDTPVDLVLQEQDDSENPLAPAKLIDTTSVPPPSPDSVSPAEYLDGTTPPNPPPPATYINL